MSKSGIDTRSGLRKRSNRRPKRRGSRSVIVSDQATTEPAPDRDALALRPLDEIGDDQEIPGKPGLHDHVELEFETLAIRLRRVTCVGEAEHREPDGEPGARGGAQRAFLVGAVRRREGRQDRLVRLRDKGAALGDDQRVVAGFRQIGKEGAHLRRRAEIMLGGQMPAIVIGDRAALRDAH
jgi:hypothetical protein